MDEVSWWVAVLIAIPLAIIANLLTPLVTKWLDRNSRERSRAEKSRLRQEYETIKQYHEDRDDFRDYQFSIVIKTVYLAAIGAFFSTAPATILAFMGIGGVLRNLTVGIIQLATLVAAFAIIRICREALRMNYRVRHFDEYVDAVGERLNESTAPPANGMVHADEG